MGDFRGGQVLRGFSVRTLLYQWRSAMEMATACKRRKLPHAPPAQANSLRILGLQLCTVNSDLDLRTYCACLRQYMKRWRVAWECFGIFGVSDMKPGTAQVTLVACNKVAASSVTRGRQSIERLFSCPWCFRQEITCKIHTSIASYQLVVSDLYIEEKEERFAACSGSAKSCSWSLLCWAASNIDSEQWGLGHEMAELNIFSYVWLSITVFPKQCAVLMSFHRPIESRCGPCPGRFGGGLHSVSFQKERWWVHGGWAKCWFLTRSSRPRKRSQGRFWREPRARQPSICWIIESHPTSTSSAGSAGSKWWSSIGVYGPNSSHGCFANGNISGWVPCLERFSKIRIRRNWGKLRCRRCHESMNGGEFDNVQFEVEAQETLSWVYLLTDSQYAWKSRNYFAVWLKASRLGHSAGPPGVWT